MLAVASGNSTSVEFCHDWRYPFLCQVAISHRQQGVVYSPVPQGNLYRVVSMLPLLEAFPRHVLVSAWHPACIPYIRSLKSSILPNRYRDPCASPSSQSCVAISRL